MTISRRQFLLRGGLLAAGTAVRLLVRLAVQLVAAVLEEELLLLHPIEYRPIRADTLRTACKRKAES